MTPETPTRTVCDGKTDTDKKSLRVSVGWAGGFVWIQPPDCACEDGVHAAPTARTATRVLDENRLISTPPRVHRVEDTGSSSYLAAGGGAKSRFVASPLEVRKRIDSPEHLLELFQPTRHR